MFQRHRIYPGNLGGFMGFWDAAKGVLGGGVFSKDARKFAMGTSDKYKQNSLLGPEQQPGYSQLQQSIAGPGAGGSWGTAADYYRSLMSDDNSTFDAMKAPEMRRFNEEIIPGLSEQFAGMGAGGMSSSGFRNAAIGAGTDLSERLGSIRAQLRQQGAQGLMNLGQQGLGHFNENILEKGQQGFLSQMAPVAGQALTKWATGGMG